MNARQSIRSSSQSTVPGMVVVTYEVSWSARPHHGSHTKRPTRTTMSSHNGLCIPNITCPMTTTARLLSSAPAHVDTNTRISHSCPRGSPPSPSRPKYKLCTSATSGRATEIRIPQRFMTAALQHGEQMASSPHHVRLGDKAGKYVISGGLSFYSKQRGMVKRETGIE